MNKVNSVITILADNSNMKSKKNKEDQNIAGKSVVEIIRSTASRYGEIHLKEELNAEIDNVIFFMGHAPLIDLDFVLNELEQYSDDIVLFKDIKEREVALFITDKIYNNYLNEIKSDWTTFSDLLTILEESYRVVDIKDLVCIESKMDLVEVSRNIQRKLNNKIIESGVTIINRDATYIDFDVEVGLDTVIYPNTFITGKTVIGEDCIIGPDSRVKNSTIGNNTSVIDTTITDSKVADETNIGPYAYLRPNSNIGSKVKIGDFVEIKNANIGDGTKISHLSYVGDADLGKNINIGCGVVFTNYNGRDKNRSVVHDDSFIGCNVNIVAPVVIEEMAYVAAGTTVTKDVPSGALAVARARQENKEGWVKKRNLIKKKNV